MRLICFTNWDDRPTHSLTICQIPGLLSFVAPPGQRTLTLKTESEDASPTSDNRDTRPRISLSSRHSTLGYALLATSGRVTDAKQIPPESSAAFLQRSRDTSLARRRTSNAKRRTVNGFIHSCTPWPPCQTQSVTADTQNSKPKTQNAKLKTFPEVTDRLFTANGNNALPKHPGNLPCALEVSEN
jgi:hypothetical protein